MKCRAYVLFQKTTWEQMPAREKAFIIYCVGAIVLVGHLFLLGSQFHLGKALLLWKLGREPWRATTSSLDTNTHSLPCMTKILQKWLMLNTDLKIDKCGSISARKENVCCNIQIILRLYKFQTATNNIASSSRMFTTSEQRNREALAAPQGAQNSQCSPRSRGGCHTAGKEHEGNALRCLAGVTAEWLESNWRAQDSLWMNRSVFLKNAHESHKHGESVEHAPTRTKFKRCA